MLKGTKPSHILQAAPLSGQSLGQAFRCRKRLLSSVPWPLRHSSCLRQIRAELPEGLRAIRPALMVPERGRRPILPLLLVCRRVKFYFTMRPLLMRARGL